MHRFLFIATLSLAGFLVLHEAWAVTQSVTANISFDTPLTMNKTADINFGTVKAAVADTYTISTSGTVTAAGSGAYLGGATSHAHLILTGSTTQAYSVSVSGYTANGGVTPKNATCSWNGLAAGPCSFSASPAGTGATIDIGVDVVVDGTQAPGATAAPTFTVTAVYN